MTDKVTNELLFEHLRRIQNDIGELKQMRVEMREGFASMRTHFLAQQGDISTFERRLIDLEDNVSRINHRLDIHDNK